MAAKRKISIRKILQLALTILVSAGCIVAIVSASRIDDRQFVKSVAIHIRDNKKYHFIEQKEIMDLAINNRHIDVAHTPLSKLDIHGMEQLIMADPWVSGAQVFVDNAHVLHMYVTQRIPVVRLFQQNGHSCYLDTTLNIMPLSGSNIYYTTVVTNVPGLKNDSAGLALRKQIVALVRKIQADSFWNAQVSQVIVDSDGSFELLPVLGNQTILFGNATRMDEKFSNLFVFYKKVLNRIGWDKYQTLDVRFKGQVVASPSLPYKGPVDKAVVNMNWINSIVQTDAGNDAAGPLNDKGSKVKPAAVAAAAKTQVKQIKKAAAKTKKPLSKTTKKQAPNGSAKKNEKAVEKKRIIAKAAVRKPGKLFAKPVSRDSKKNKDKEKIGKQRKPKYILPEEK